VAGSPQAACNWMKVILLRDVARIGRRYEVKEVPSGHALNFLIPRKLVEPATPENLKRVEAQRKKQETTVVLEAEHFDEALEKLKELKVSITAEANEQGHLFKGVKVEDIARALQSEGLQVDVRHINLPHPLKAVGPHEIELHSGKKKGTFVLNIVGK
jgi:large subunit ribosomal protein L9